MQPLFVLDNGPVYLKVKGQNPDLKIASQSGLIVFIDFVLFMFQTPSSPIQVKRPQVWSPHLRAHRFTE